MQLVDNYKDIALSETPMIDVRAPIEYAKGTILNAVNLPLMTDDERRDVGICYKKHGQDQAVSLGHKLVSGEVKAKRLDNWCHYFDTHPNSHIFCFRGGLRSRISQQWIVETGRDIPLIKGGYKAFRQFLTQQSETITTQLPLLIVGGQTGCGKTELLDDLNGALDLEGLANHRGSAFGKNITPQPSQIDFENAIAKHLLKIEQAQLGVIITEDESRLIGRCALPLHLREKMAQAPVYMLQDSFEQRCLRILKSYVIDMLDAFMLHDPQQGFLGLSEHLHNALFAIRKRLGAERYSELKTVLDAALAKQLSQNDATGHLQWIEVLLRDYYDPLYQYQLGKKQHRIVYKGNHQQLLDILANKQREYRL